MDISELDRTSTYGNATKGVLAVVRYKDKGHLDDIAFELESRMSLDSPVAEGADELRKRYMDFAIGKVIGKHDNADTTDWFDHHRWIDAFFMKFLNEEWTFDTLPTLEDCKRYREKERLGDCLPFAATIPFIKVVGKDEREEVLAKCGIGGCRMDNCVYRLRRDAETGETFLLREDFAILCNRRKRDEIKGVAKEEKTPNWMTDTEDGADVAWVEEYGRTHGTTARKDAAHPPVREQLELF